MAVRVQKMVESRDAVTFVVQEQLVIFCRDYKCTLIDIVGLSCDFWCTGTDRMTLSSDCQFTGTDGLNVCCYTRCTGTDKFDCVL